MTEPLFGLTRADRNALSGVVAKHNQQLPPTGQSGGGVSVPTGLILGKADAAISQNNSGTISIWLGATSATVTDSTKNMTAYARMGDVASGAWVYLVRMPCGWEVFMTPC